MGEGGEGKGEGGGREVRYLCGAGDVGGVLRGESVTVTTGGNYVRGGRTPWSMEAEFLSGVSEDMVRVCVIGVLYVCVCGNMVFKVGGFMWFLRNVED
jgi:hypothetical protein